MSVGESEQSKAGRKLAIATAMLLFSSHRLPGVRGYELRRRLGKNYLKIIDTLNHRLSPLGLRVKVVFEEGNDQPSDEDFDRARFFITLSEPLSLSDIVAAGWRIDDLAILSATLAYLFSRGGKAHQNEVMELLETKFPKWRIEAAMERFTRRGYLHKDEDNMIYIGWRAFAEVDQKELVKAITEISPELSETSQDSSETSSGEPPSPSP